MEAEPVLMEIAEPNRPPLSRRKRIGCTIIVVLVALTLLWWLGYGFGSPVHYSDDIQGKVIDEDTGQPLAGVVVSAVWWLRTIGQGDAYIAYKAQAITNERGEYVLGGMPPRLRPPLTWFRNQDPIIRLYKPGYRTEDLDNTELSEFGWQGPFDKRSAKRRCFWDGKTVPLQPARTVDDEARAFRSAENFAADHKMWPPQFGLLWSVLVKGYDRLPPDVREREQIGDPREYIDYWTKESSK